MSSQTASTKSKVKVVDEHMTDLESDIVLREKATGKTSVQETLTILKIKRRRKKKFGASNEKQIDQSGFVSISALGRLAQRKSKYSKTKFP